MVSEARGGSRLLRPRDAHHGSWSAVPVAAAPGAVARAGAAVPCGGGAGARYTGRQTDWAEGRGGRGTLGPGTGNRLWGLEERAELGGHGIRGQVSRHCALWPGEIPSRSELILIPGFSFPPVQRGESVFKVRTRKWRKFEGAMSRPVKGACPQSGHYRVCPALVTEESGGDVERHGGLCPITCGVPPSIR